MEVPLNVTVTDDGFGLTIEEREPKFYVLRMLHCVEIWRELQKHLKVSTGVSEEEINILGQT